MLLEHNVNVYNTLEQTLTDNNCCCVVMGTGCGKTYVASEYLNKNNFKALVVSPRRSICESWEKHTDRVDTITYQKLANIYKDIDFSNYDVVICDEVHHIGAPTWGEPIKHLIDNKIIKVIGLTESSIRYTDGGKDVAEDFFYGNVAFGETVSSAIEKKILNPVTYVGAMFNSDGLKKTLRGKIQSRLYAKLNLVLNNTPTVTEILKKHMPAGKRKGIIFASTIEDIQSAIDFVKSVYPNVETRFVHSKQPQSYNDAAFDWFKNTDEGYICSVDMISEGVHIKGVNTLIMLRRTESVNLFNQQIGRCLDASSKEPAIVFDLVNNKYSIRIIHDKFKIKTNSIFDSGKLNVVPSQQLIVNDYTKDIVEVLKEIKLNLEGRWTEYEDNLLREFYKEHPNGKGLKEFVKLNLRDKTVPAASNRAIYLGLSSPFSISYSEDEIEIIKKYYPTEGSACYKRLQNRTKESVLAYASSLGIKYFKTWTEEEDNLLKGLYNQGKDLNFKELKLKYFPNKSIASIKRRAQTLGLVFKKALIYFTEEEDNIIRQYYPIEGSLKIQKRIPNHNSGSIRTRAIILGIKSGKIKHWSDEEVEILKRYYPIEGLKVREKLPNRNDATIRAKAIELGVKRKKPLILCVELNKRFKTSKEAADFLNNPKAAKVIIETLSCRKKSNEAYGYHWEYVEEEEN